MKIFLFATMFIVLAVQALAQEKQVLPEDPLAGANVFVQKNCYQCHSIKSDEVRSHLGPNLGSIHLKGSLLDIAGLMWNHGPAMSQQMKERKIDVPKFTGKEMANLVAFLTAYQYYLKEVGHPGDPSKGKVVWENKHCGACHSFQENWEKVGPSLHTYRNVSAIQMAQAMWNHGPEMIQVMASHQMSIPKFSGSEMLDLISYIRTEVSAVREEIYVQPGNPNRGAVLFQQKKCISCHPISGKGGSDAPDLAKQRELLHDVSYVAGLMWNHSVGMWTEMKRKDISIPKFSGGEMADIIAYLYLINYYDPPGDPARGKILFEKRYCSGCHRFSDPPGIGPNLIQVQHLDSSLEVIAGMWNHIPEMSRKMQELGVVWPRIQPGEMKDLIAYLLSERKNEENASTHEQK